MKTEIDELESLLFDWEAGSLDESGIARVQEMLRSSREAREAYAQFQLLSAALKLEGDAGLGPHSSLTTSSPAQAQFSNGERISDAEPLTGQQQLAGRSWAKTAFVLATGLILCLAGRVLYLEFSNTQTSGVNALSGNANSGNALSGTTVAGSGRTGTTEATSSGIALLTRLVDVQWAAGQSAMEVGDALEPGQLAIESGYAQVEFFCGATVVLEGPAVLDLKTATLARVLTGRLRAQVPPAARGFSLEVDDMKVVDLGTEFGLVVTPEGSDIQVFDGEVELHKGDDTRQRLVEGEGVQRNAAGSFQLSETSPAEFVDIASLESRATSQQADRFQRWKNYSEQLRTDSRLITYYAFDQHGDWTRTLNNSLQPVDHEFDGAIVGAARVTGRWPGKSGLEFKRPGDRVRIQIPGEYGSLSFACWVKIDSLDRWYNSLFLTDGYNKGEPHWQILDSGQLFFSVRVSSDDGGQEHREVLSPSFWNPSLSGKWLHLATTYDVDQKQVCHYLNGSRIHEETIPDQQLASVTRFGKATIGNWTSPQRPDEDFAIRNLNGRIDEFALFAAVLSEQEIQTMYKNGKP